MSKPCTPPTKYTLLHVTQAGPGLNVFWWRWSESNRRPQRLHLEGITTISLLYDTPIYVSTRADPPPHLTNVETSKKPTRIQPRQLQCQLRNCSLVPRLNYSQQPSY